MATQSHRLSHDLAVRIVTDWRRRLPSDFGLSCNITYRPHEFVSTWDTLAVVVKGACSLFDKARKPLLPMLVLREAIEVWHAVSCCAGFGFDENPAFWEHVLQLKFESRWPTIKLAVKESFPLVLIHWDIFLGFLPYPASGDRDSAHSDSNSRSPDSHLGAFFGMLSDDMMTTRSLDHQTNLQEIGPVVQSSLMETVPIRVKLRFTVEKTTHGKFLTWLDSDYQAIQAHLQSPPQRCNLEPEVVFLGLQLVVKAAPHAIHFKWLPISCWSISCWSAWPSRFQSSLYRIHSRRTKLWSSVE